MKGCRHKLDVLAGTTLVQTPSSVLSLAHALRSSLGEVLLLRGCSLTLSSLPRHRSLANGNGDHSYDSRHDFENGCVASRSDDDGGFEIDVGVTETSLAMS